MKTILQGDCIDRLKELPDKSVNCIVTSPPYYGLRDYGTGEWVGGDPDCPHRRVSKYSEKTITGHAQEELAGNVGDAIYKTVCPLCGAVRVDKQIGLEETPEEYISRLVNVFHECYRVLADDGTLWVNIGDSYATGGGRTERIPSSNSKLGENTSKAQNEVPFVGTPEGCKAKDLIGIPWMLAFALRADGWYLRQDIIWQKPNPMPESVKDRCTKSHEYIFLLSKNQRYSFDYEAIQETATSGETERAENHRSTQNSKYLSLEQEASVRQGMNRNRGTNIIAVRKELPSQEVFVAFMRSRTTVEQLANETDIPRTTIEHWFRKDNTGFAYPSVEDWISIRDYVDDWSEDFIQIDKGMTEVVYETDEIGKNSCGKRNKRDVWNVATQGVKEAHFATFPEKLIEPCILAGCQVGGVVLDPFCGSGTTGIVSVRHQRDFIGIELNPEYAEMSIRRIEKEEQQGIQISLFA